MTVARPLLLICASYVSGMYIVAFFGANAAFTVIFCALLTLVIKTVKTKNVRRNIIFYVSFIVLCVGFCMYTTSFDAGLRPAYNYCNDKVKILGEVTGNIRVSEKYVGFDVKVTHINDGENDIKINEKIPVVYFKEKEDSFIVPSKGDVISALCTLSIPDGAMNTGGFDYAAYLKTKEIYFQGICDAETLVVTGHNSHLISDAVYNFRQKCTGFFDAVFPPEECGILKAYILGDKSSLSDDASKIFSASGLSHVLAVSGMHVVIFISCLVSFLKLIKVSKQKQRIISAVAVVFFLMFTGVSTSSIRAASMSFIAIFSKYIFKRSDPLTSLLFVAACFCVANPQIIFEASFMLSFGATLGILIFTENSHGIFSWIYDKISQRRLKKLVMSVIDLMWVGLAAQIFTIPILIYLFKSFSTVSAIATIVVTPLLSPMLIGGLLFTFVSFISSHLAYPIAGFIYLCAKALNVISKIFAKFSFSQISFGGITPFMILLYISVITVLCFITIHKNKIGYFVSLYSVVFLSVVYLFHSVSLANVAEVSFINVGEGDCSLIKAPGNCDILIDSGGAEDDYSTGENIVKPYLVQNGVYDIEYAIASHGHEDHINGIIGLLDIMKIKNIIVPCGFGHTEAGELLIKKAEENHIPIIYIKHGDMLVIDDKMKITAIMPDDKFLAYTDEKDENDRSLLLKLEYGENSFLFTGDITSVCENYAVSKYADMLSADVLKIAHHGSKYSSTDNFLNVVSADYAYIPSGENMYGHPHDEVLERLRNNDTTYYRADKEKDVTFYFDLKSINGIKFGGSYDIR